MRLLEICDRGRVRFTKELINNLPKYAILSHTWGEDEDEVTFSDIQDGQYVGKPGFDKIRFCIEQARKDKIDYVWVDTCCINKTDNNELQYAINSMFEWYKNSDKCYVFLSDVSVRKRPHDERTNAWESSFRNCRWFTRGWTLQELLAPSVVEFYTRDGDRLGSKSSLEQTVHEITGIPVSALRGVSLFSFNAHERMRWATKRETTRKEDKTYCLLGMFGVHMPLIYGEGEKAANRLQEEILKYNRSQQDEFGQPLDGAAFAATVGEPNSDSPSKNAALSVEERRKMLLDSMSFEQMDARRSTIKNPYSTTCQWLLKHPAYMAWNDPTQLQDHSGFLWINGKPGAGKSTLMKFTHSHAIKTKHDGDVIVSFFFNARGDEMEKSTIGMYRALLSQLLVKATDMQDILDVLCMSKSTDDSSSWTVETLCHLFSTAVTRLGGRRLKCFIDALDECDERQIREMVEFFEDLGLNAIKDGIQLYVCFASRHYPTIDIRNGRQMTLEGENGHSEDLARYVKSKLRAGQGRHTEEVKQQILKKANGIFMWVVLVVNILNDEFRRGRIFAVRQRLKEIPPEISSLLKSILRRDDNNTTDLLLCLQWLLFARRPLRREEFYFAMVSGFDSEHRDLPEWDPERLPVESMNRFILDASRGLAELTKSKVPTVQFIHESVRDFFLKENGLYDIWPDLGMNMVARSHDRLKRCCESYLHADGVIYMMIEANRQSRMYGVTKSSIQDLNTKSPFFEYAIHQVLYHADEAAIAIPQTDFLEHFNLSRWIMMNNLLERYAVRRYSPKATLLYILAENNLARLIRTLCQGCPRIGVEGERYRYPLFAALARGHRDAFEAMLGLTDNDAKDIVFDPESWGAFSVPKVQTPLMWAFDRGLPQLAEILVQATDIDVNFQDKEGYSALHMAAAKGYETIVDIILNMDTTYINSRNHDGHTPVRLSIIGGHANIIQKLLAGGADTCVGGFETNLSLAVESGLDHIVKLVIESGTKVELYATKRNQAFGLAIRSGNDNMTQALVAYGADIEVCIERDERALHVAARCGHDTVVKTLLDLGANVEACTAKGESALHLAAQQGHDTVVQLLLSFKSDVEARSATGTTALHLAARQGHHAVSELLLAHGADVEACTTLNETPLHLAAHAGHSGILELLLNYKADVGARNGTCATALHIAARHGYENILHLLLERGADLEAVDQNGMTALFWAAQFRSVSMHILLDCGANIEHKEFSGRTALLLACHQFCKWAVSLLLERGADIESTDEHGHTPLIQAIITVDEDQLRVHSSRHRALDDYQMQLLLLEQRNKKRLMMARKEQRDPSILTTCGTLEDRQQIIALLLAKNANVEMVDREGKTALLLATEMGDEDTVKLLLAHHADVKATGPDVKTALMIASEIGALTIFRLLVEEEAKVNTEKDHVQPGIVLAMGQGHGKTLSRQSEEEKSASNQTMSNRRKTASLKVYQRDKEAIVQLLVNDDEKNDHEGEIKHSWAMQLPFDELVERLVRQCEDLAKDTRSLSQPEVILPVDSE